MNREVHYEFTRSWAIDAGFSEEEAVSIAAADWDVDRIHDVHVWRNKGYHFAWLGAYRKARTLLAQAVERGDLVALGEALHCAQDAISHGFWGHVWHWKGIDRWGQRGAGVQRRIEQRSREMLEVYRSSLELSAKQRHSVTIGAECGGSGEPDTHS
ncbi:MAG: hypothetical protein CVT67_05555 [Actinobacteria bacterium HGW-Actinobacteria-7]|nr:MAG: hypothetical protein CVT67_05555 [Actinobacteria bacterium HGW-Actinobacteria-7]